MRKQKCWLKISGICSLEERKDPTSGHLEGEITLLRTGNHDLLLAIKDMGGGGRGEVWWKDSGCVTEKLTRAPRLCNILMPLFAPPSLPTSYWLLIGSRFF